MNFNVGGLSNFSSSSSSFDEEEEQLLADIEAMDAEQETIFAQHAVFRMLAYGCPVDATDKYIKIGESTTIESLKRFYRAVVEKFACEYLRSPNAIDVVKLLRIGKDHDFPRMLSSLDCMHRK
ncbi:hypothetical protein Ddye_008090 [Dipteronia dyeriana]|uniref:Uncharacterized protein n=1 Tax=Dipteronia dyeriana TaxID=168575 RepID=A0AAD9X985_9ROSI|nr:hypothetical protein Ddye_008090 [Dipteronia dyeriana]